PPGKEPTVIALRATRAFDGDRFVDNAVVVVDGDVITDVGESVPAGAEVVELGDALLTPGLIDTHQHLVFNGQGTLEEQVVGVSDEELRERARANAARALRAGITTIRDLGDRGFVTVDLVGDPALPTILASGPPLTPMQGHCWYLGGECADIDELRAAVHARKARGCAVVKLMATGGHGTPTYPMWKSQFTTDELRAVIATAHGVGLPVAAHCHGVGGIASAVEVGVDTIEHCTFFSESGGSEPDETLIKSIAAAGIPVSATYGQLPGSEPPPVIKANIDKVIGALLYLRECGGTIVIGTDAGIGPPKPHDVLPYAFDMLTEIGMTPAQALASMTSVSARVLGLGDRKGRLAAGYDADIRASGAALTDVRGVWLRGARVV
ncbi:MAG TPA: amidohydrolase family protein, partial [Acidimicrobiales bacterium]|nr:amidohydrolase family protein [Acidimicrobiales bacterium]